MVIWLCLLIPAAAVVVLALFFQHKMAWWEYLLQFGVPCLAILLAKVAVEKVATADREFWNSYVTYAEYTEAWSTWDEETCTRQVPDGETCTGTGADRTCTTNYRTETYDCSHCDNHPPSWEVTDNIGRTYGIESYLFEDLCKRWGNRKFRELNRHIDHHFGCGQDGDAYRTVFDNAFEHTQPVCAVHLYENRVQASRSVFNFQKVTPDDIKKYGLFGYDYNSDIFNYNPIKGISDPRASTRLSWWNAKLGAMKKVHMMVLVFQGQPRLAGELQQSYWCGGNKNEFVLCIGVDKNRQVEWTKVFSWTEVDRLKLDVERSTYIMFSGADDGKKPLDLTMAVDSMATKVQRSFVKKSFKDFSYLSVEPSGKALLITLLVTLVVTVGLGIFCVRNDIE